ncbi:MAG: aldo/keto reductase [Myxococcota bacterium]
MIAIGTQRLALRPVNEVRTVLERARTLGVEWLDVADQYGAAPGDAERQLAPFANDFRIVTKGGLVRRGKRWEPDGRLGHLVDAALASRDRLGVDALDAFLLHAPDPRRSFKTSLRALARIQDRGIAKAVGLANVSVAQLTAALDVVPVRWVEVAVSPWDVASARSGILEACQRAQIPVLAHRPLGGADKQQRLARHALLRDMAEARGGRPAEVVLAWIASLGLVPLPGPTRVETLESCVRAASWTLTNDERAQLDATFPEGGRLRRPREQRAPSPEGVREVRIVMGSPGSGKTTHAQRFVDRGFVRLNRDDRGGTLKKLLRPLAEALQDEGSSVVLDNTYATRASRYDVIETAWAHDVPVHVTWMDTPSADCERNVVLRILDRLGRLPEPEEFETLGRRDPSIIPPRALLSFRSRFEPPAADEGFASIERVPFVRAPSGRHPGVILAPNQLERFGPAIKASRRVALVVGWEPGADPRVAAQAIEQAFTGPVHAAVCPHPAGPPICWCRMPWLGLPVLLARIHDVDLTRTVVIATRPADRTLADKLNIPYVETPEALTAL